jgi:outer membrane protein assembly factor BamB
MIRIVRTACLACAGVACLCISSTFARAATAAEAPKQDAAGRLAAQILEATGVSGGLIVQVGCGDGRLTAALGANDRSVVQGLDAVEANVAAARTHIQSLGLYGKASARQWESQRLPYGDNLVNLLVISRGGRAAAGEIERVLAPQGSALVEGQLDAAGTNLVAQSSADLDGWTRYVKPRPKDIDEWTHYLHDPGNNAVADDDRVGPPKHLQWKAGPTWCRSHEFSSSVQALVSAGGRLVGVIDEGITGQPRGVPEFWTLLARDAFNGVLLWRRPCDRVNPHALAVVGDTVYVTLTNRGPLSILDAATGETRHTCPQTGKVSEIAVCEDRVVLSTQLPGGDGDGGTHVIAVAPDDGHLLWKQSAGALAANTLVAGDGRVCFLDGNELVSVALDSGEEIWRTEVRGGGKGYAILYAGTVFLTGGSTRAFSLDTGELLWTGPDGSPHARNPPGLFGAGGLIWCAWGRVGPRSFVWQADEETREGYDPATGEVKKTVTAERLVTAGHHIRCYPPKATSRYLLLNKRGVEFFDLEGTNHMRANWTRGACGFGMLPANGFLYTPPSQCFCYQGVLLTGLNALSAAREIPERVSAASDQKPRLEKGPAYGKHVPSPSTLNPQPSISTDWPTYRHDVFRSGSIETPLPVELEPVWETMVTPVLVTASDEGPPDGAAEAPKLREYLANRLTPPVAADGRVFVAEPDAHTVYALNAEDGRHLWSFVADGRVDSPPTLYRGLCIFGCTDGHVYCLAASDGQLAWRFRAAPEERQICAMDQLESAWPVHGSVLIRDGKVYFTAGRSSYLDGGIRVYALDPASGEVLHETLLAGEDPDVSIDGGRPFDMDGTKSDILVAGEKDIYLFQERFKPDLTREPMPRVTKLGDRRGEPHLTATNGLLDTTWFNRTYWMYDQLFPGYYFTYRAPKSGQILVFDDEITCSLKAYTERRGHSPEFQPGGGYRLMADRNTTLPVLDEMDIGAEKGRGFSRTELPIWSETVPIRAQGMLLAREHLYLVGPPDLVSEQDAYESMIGKRGAVFRVVSTSDGGTLSEFTMEEVPVFDGLIAAAGRLYMSTTNGTLICLGEKK